MLGRAANLYFFNSECSFSIPLRIVSTRVSEFTFATSSNFSKVFLSSLTANCVDFGLSVLGLPVRGLTFSPHFLNTTKCSIYYGIQKVKHYFIHFSNILISALYRYMLHLQQIQTQFHTYSLISLDIYLSDSVSHSLFLACLFHPTPF